MKSFGFYLILSKHERKFRIWIIPYFFAESSIVPDTLFITSFVPQAISLLSHAPAGTWLSFSPQLTETAHPGGYYQTSDRF
jgi:hypothetical protein